MIRLLSTLAAAALLAACSTPPTDLDLSLDKPSAAGAYRVALVPPAQPPAVNQMHAWTVKLASADGRRDRWSPRELAVLSSMHLKEAGPRPADPSNAYEQRTDAASLGRALFNDTRLSRNGRVSCASCHAADQQFQDGRPLGQGIATGKRRTMPVMGASHAPFLFWDGRKDSLWSQALGPLEDPAEHGDNRVRLVRVLQAHYQPPYTRVFGAMPALGALPANASPQGTDSERAAWNALPEDRGP